MDNASRTAWQLLNERDAAERAVSGPVTKYVVKVGPHYAAANLHWAETTDAAAAFDFRTTASLYAFGQLGLGAEDFSIEQVTR